MVTITEDDTTGLVISQSAFTITEGDGTGQSYTVALATQPSAEVTVAISGQASTDLVLDKDNLTFSTSNWSSPQTVTVTASDDADALADPAVTLTHGASGGDYGSVAKDLVVTITEDDTTGLVISQSAFTITEGDGTGQSYTVALATQPSAEVTVAISGQASTDLVLDKDNLTFSTSNWSSPQTVTVTASDDADALADPAVTLTHRASGGDYGSVAKDLVVTITEDDTTGLVISQSAFTITEGDGTGQSYTVALATQPSAEVTVAISGQASTDLVLDKDNLTFSTSNWSSPQTVTVTASDDADALTDPAVTLTHRASGGDYGSVAKDLVVTITEDDTTGLVISQSAFTITEGDGTGQSYTVALATQPSAEVTVAISGQASTDLVLDKDNLTFSTSNWSSPQTVTVTASDDADALTDLAVTLTHRASGGDYGSVAKDLVVTITEDDTTGLVISQSAFTITEGDGTGQSYTVALATQPSAEVTVAISGQASTDLVLDKDNLTFSTSNWSSPQTVTVTASDDADALTDPAVTLTHGASGGDYGSVAKDLVVTITEDDTTGLVISQSALTVLEGDATGFGFPIQVVDNHYSVAPGNEELQHNIPQLAVTLPDGRVIPADFLGHYRETGGFARWGYPTSEVFVLENGALTQFYQRGVVDFHDVGSGWVIERRLAWDYIGGGFGGAPDQGVEEADEHAPNPYPGIVIGPWGNKVSNFAIDGTDVGFADFFFSHGGIVAFGYPKSEARYDSDEPGTLRAPGTTTGFIRQYFQAAIFEYHPDDPQEKVKLTLLGDILLEKLVADFASRDPFRAAPRIAQEGEYDAN